MEEISNVAGRKAAVSLIQGLPVVTKKGHLLLSFFPLQSSWPEQYTNSYSHTTSARTDMLGFFLISPITSRWVLGQNTATVSLVDINPTSRLLNLFFILINTAFLSKWSKGLKHAWDRSCFLWDPAITARHFQKNFFPGGIAGEM
ncbi:MAG: hypothetical protein K6T29_01155 [Peptococcaceae bacterium]|nr:hypothetical protein [Peptococcaceae bacterium]